MLPSSSKYWPKSGICGHPRLTVELINVLDVIGLPGVGSTNPGNANFAANDIFTQNVTCDFGTATVTWNDADNNLIISTGDTFDVGFATCFFADSGTVTAVDALKESDCEVIQAMEMKGIINATAKFQFPMTVTFEPHMESKVEFTVSQT